MAKIDATQDTSTHESADDSDAARVDRLVARFEKEDAASGAPADDDDQDEENQDDAGSDDDRDDSDDSEDTDDDAGQRRGESDDEDEDEGDSEDTDDDEDDEDDVESPDDAEDTDDEESDDTEDTDDASGETKAALTKHGADLTLEDVPEKFRPIVEQKLKRIDQAFTKAQMEATAFRARERKYLSEETYRGQNPDLFIVDMLRKGGDDLFGKVNKLLNRLNPAEDGNTEESVKDAEVLLDEKIEMRRRKAMESIDAVEKETARITEEAGKIESWASEAATKFRVPMGTTIEKLLEAAILRKPTADRAAGLTQDEVHAIVKEHADEHFQSVRAHRREASKGSVKDRTAARGRQRETVKAPRTTASPGPRRPVKEKVDHNDAESRQKAMMRSARRIMPGVK